MSRSQLFGNQRVPAPKLVCQHDDVKLGMPDGYLDRAEWALEMLKTHRQKRCPACGLWAIWVPKKR